MAETVTILSPLDLKQGTVAPDGRIIVKSHLHAGAELVLVDVVFNDGSARVFNWPSGKGWVVDGRVGA